MPMRTLQEMKRVLLEEWCVIPRDLSNNLIKLYKIERDVCIFIRDDYKSYERRIYFKSGEIIYLSFLSFLKFEFQYFRINRQWQYFLAIGDYRICQKVR